MSATCGGIRVVSVYVPNGRVPDSDHYRYKLAWLGALREMLARRAQPELVVCGDMNIAPTDEDVFNPEAYVGHTHVTPPERAALAGARGARPARRRARSLAGRARVQLLGLPRRHVPPGPRHADRPGPRQRPPVASGVRPRGSTAQARKGSGPSDHAPVIVDLDEAPDGDIGPVVPPPSAPAPRGRQGQAAAIGADARRRVALAVAVGRGRARARRRIGPSPRGRTEGAALTSGETRAPRLRPDAEASLRL